MKYKLAKYFIICLTVLKVDIKMNEWMNKNYRGSEQQVIVSFIARIFWIYYFMSSANFLLWLFSWLSVFIFHYCLSWLLYACIKKDAVYFRSFWYSKRHDIQNTFLSYFFFSPGGFSTPKYLCKYKKAIIMQYIFIFFNTIYFLSSFIFLSTPPPTKKNSLF